MGLSQVWAPPAMSHIKARADADAATLFALGHLGQHHFLVEQLRLGELQPYQVSHCLENLGRLPESAICLNIHHLNRLQRHPLVGGVRGTVLVSHHS